MQTTIKMAEARLGEGIPIRILKLLFLLKWVRESKATPRNIAILLIDRPNIDIRAHNKAVLDALALPGKPILLAAQHRGRDQEHRDRRNSGG
jgi:hypothetical protein